MFLFLTAMRWWKYATQWKLGSVSLPRPTRWTLLSGICTAGVIATTTLAYTFAGISIVFMMLLMRGGVLILAPIVDSITGRSVRWYSTVGLVLSINALLVAFLEDKGAGFALTLIALADVIIYLGCYFVRLRFMSRLAKTDDFALRTRFFVEEQMVATPVLVLFLGTLALIDQGAFMHQLRIGFTDFMSSPLVIYGIVIGFCSQGTGIFGGLVLLDKRENTFAVPVNRCASVIAGVVATYVGMWFLDGRSPSTHELMGVFLIIQAMIFLAVPEVMAARARARARSAAAA